MLLSKIETLSRYVTVLVVSFAALFVFAVPLTYAAPATPPATDSTCVNGNEASCAVNQPGGGCSTDQNKITNCTDPAVSDTSCKDTTSSCDLLTQYVQPFMDFLAALVGVAVTVSIIIGGIQYGSSAGDSSKVSAAKNRIRNAIIALVAFLFLYALLDFIVPGGLIK